MCVTANTFGQAGRNNAPQITPSCATYRGRRCKRGERKGRERRRTVSGLNESIGMVSVHHLAESARTEIVSSTGFDWHANRSRFLGHVTYVVDLARPLEGRKRITTLCECDRNCVRLYQHANGQYSFAVAKLVIEGCNKKKHKIKTVIIEMGVESEARRFSNKQLAINNLFFTAEPCTKINYVRLARCSDNEVYKTYSL